MFRRILLGLVAIGIAGCGGGGSGNNNGVSTPPPSAGPELLFFGDDTVTTGDSVGIAVTTSTGERISSIQWRTNSAVTVLAAHTQAIGFDASAVGNIVFDVEATLASGESLSSSYTVTVTSGESPKAIARLAHEATEGGRVSLRVDSPLADQVSSIRWTQLSGPAISDIRYDDDVPAFNMYFDAPRVTQDSVIEFNAIITFTDGSTAEDQVVVVVADSDINTSSFFPDNDMFVTHRLLPHRSDSPYANALQDCTYSNTITSSCRFSVLPLLGQVTESPSVDDVLDRVLVSHPWMGIAFENFLRSTSAQSDLLKLFRATTAIVISYDIRPSFYWVATGAIYLDANNFWRTPEERDTLNKAPDYRSGFGNDLNFRYTWRYAKDNAYYYPQPGLALSARSSRDTDKVEAASAWLLYHELAHANDYFSYETWSQLATSASPLSSYGSFGTVSDRLDQSLPLTSAQLHALAQVNYGGATATTSQRAVTADQAAAEFSADGAASFYGYYTEREDFATLFERFMMLFRLGVDADVGFFTAQTFLDREYAITWGQRNRVADPLVQGRVAFVVERILPSIDVIAAQQQVPSAQLLPVGVSWFDAVDLSGQATDSLNPVGKEPPYPLLDAVHDNHVTRNHFHP